MCMGVWGGPTYVYGSVGRSNLCVWWCREVQLMCMVCREVQLMCMVV